MKLITLGTSHGAAEKDRFCTANILEINGKLYLIDCGAPVEALLPKRGLKTDDIHAVFITHMHEDHIGGLSAIHKKFSTYHRERSLEIFLPEEEGISGFLGWMRALHSPENCKNIAVSLVSEGEFYSDENIRVTAIRNRHLGNIPSYSYIIEAENKQILFTGDMDSNFFDFPKISKGRHFNLVVSEFTHYNDLELACKNLSTANCDRMVLNHVQSGKYEMLLGNAHYFPYKVTVANDGEAFEI